MQDSPKVNPRHAILAALILTLLFALQNWAATDQDLLPSIGRQAIVWGVWLALLPWVLASARRRPPLAAASGRWIRGLVRVGLGYCVLHGTIAGLTRWMLGIAVYPNLIDVLGSNVIAALGRNFITYAMIVAAYQAVVYHRAILDRDRRAANLEVDLSAARLDSLEGRLRPHFLFNTLNAIAALVRVDPAKAETLIGQLSDLLRASLRADPSREVTLDEELELVGHYLAIERTRFEDRLSVTVDATSEARRAMVPHLILQPLVENAVRHGIAPRDRAGHVAVRAGQRGDRLQIVVEDDGVGMGNAPDDQRGNGIGLGGVKSRLAFLYGSSHTVDITHVVPTGTRVLLDIPYRTAAVPT